MPCIHATGTPRVLTAALVLPFLLCFAAPGRPEEAAGGFRLSRIEIHTRYAKPPAETYRPIIPLREGQTVTEDEVRAAEQTLRESRLFRSISSRVEEAPEGKVLIFDLSQEELVRRVRVRGSWLVLTSVIQRSLTMQIGDPFREENLAAEKEHIIAVFEGKGWFGTTVSSTFERDPSDGSVQIDYRIQRGRLLRKVDVALKGVNAGDPERIRKILRTWPWLTTKRLHRKLEKVEKYYVKLGYPTARARVVSRKDDLEAGRAHLEIEVKEGRRLVVSIEGARALPEKKLRRAMTFAKSRAYGFFDAEDSAHAMRRLYQEKGFPEAAVRFRRQESEDEVHVRFTVEEGPRAFLREIDFVGNEGLADRKLSRQILTKPRCLLIGRRGAFVEEQWRQDEIALTDRYVANGYLDVKTTHELASTDDADRVKLEVQIEEGPRHTVATTRIEGLPSGWEERVRKGMTLRPGQPFYPGRLAREARRVVRLLADGGYLLARVDTDYTVREDHGVVSVLRVDPGPQFRLSGIVVAGNRKTHTGKIESAFRLRPGDPIGNESLARSQRRLQKLGMFNGLTVRVPGREADVGTTPEDTHAESPEERIRPVIVQVQERKSLRMEVGGRFDSDLGLEGVLSVWEENLLGRAMKLRLDGLIGQERAEAVLGITDPTLLGYRLTGSVQGKFTQERYAAYTDRRVSTELTVHREFRNRYTPSLGFLLERAEVFDVQSGALDAPEPSLSTNLFIRPQFVIDTRNDKIYPTHGIYLLASAAVSNHAWASDDELVRYAGRLRGYHEIFPKWSVAARLSVDHVEPYGATDRVPTTEFFFAGGNNTVRGFPKDGLGPRDSAGVPTGGRTRLLGSCEVRFPIYRLLYGVAFVDVGSLTDGWKQVTTDSFRWSAGGGLRLHTPVGPVRVEYGYQLQSNPPLDRGEFHFSLGFPF